MTAKTLASSLVLLAAACAFPASEALASATVTINNIDGPGEGFNDPTVQPASPTNGCLAAETLGTCRLRVFTTAANQWGQLLNSTVTIQVNAAMNPLTCSGTSAVLGSAGPQNAFAGFVNAPRANTAYVSAEANSLAGTDLDAGVQDINAQFNITLDSGTCLTGTTGWWYGTNPLVPSPNDRTPLLPVVFHEIGHGLGFVSLYSNSSGANLTAPDNPIWGYYLYDKETSKLFKDMTTNAERLISIANDPDLVWTGPRANKQSVKFLGPPAKVQVNSPAGIAGFYDAQTAEFGANVATSPVTGDVVLVNDGVIGPIDGTHPALGTVNDGCETYPAPVTGKIALVDRGYCTFVIKAQLAQAAGAIGLIVANNTTGLPGMGGSDPAITIPSLGTTQAAGIAIKANLPAPGVNATLGVQTGAALAGTNSGCIRMNAPTPIVTGSSVSHWTPDTFPNLLMEPALNRSIFDKVDLTLPLFEDIGWSMTPENILFIDGFDNNPCQFVQP